MPIQLHPWKIRYNQRFPGRRLTSSKQYRYCSAEAVQGLLREPICLCASRLFLFRLRSLFFCPFCFAFRDQLHRKTNATFVNRNLRFILPIFNYSTIFFISTEEMYIIKCNPFFLQLIVLFTLGITILCKYDTIYLYPSIFIHLFYSCPDSRMRVSMRKTLYLKFVLAYLIFGCFGFAVVATFGSNMTREHLRREKADTLYKEATLIANSYASDLYNNEASLETVKDQLDSLSVYLNSTVWIINPSGLMILDTASPVDVEHPRIIEGFNAAQNEGTYYTIGTFYNSFDQEMLSVFAPITANFKVQGYVVIHTSTAALNVSAESILSITYIILMILFLLSLIILIFFTEFVYLPLRKITEATEQYAAGNMHYEFQVDSEDEIGYLAASLSYMASEIARSEDNQKKFIANVSHDFRSPLTSIRGYLEAMLDGTIPAELYSKYLKIVLNETDRLTKLTSSLLTLNNLNTKGMVLEKSVFDLNAVIRNTAASFEGTCRQKRIAIELVLTGDELQVNADILKIQQVLYNLLDNAIKFSHSDSVIKIETTERRNKVFVSVKDRGIGIPKDSLKLIWDRFYKTDLSRGKDKKGTGLGLAITKEIIRAHDENINVISTEGVGTEFIFSLPVTEHEED